jgi:Tfp pilus assembly protein PilN
VCRGAKGVDVAAAASISGAWTVGEEAFEKALRSFVYEHGIASDDVYTVLPRHEMTARILVLPSQAPEEVASMVKLSVEEYVPYPAREVVVDQCILAKLPDGQSRVLAVFAHRDVVEGYVSMLRACALEPERIFVSTACLATAVAQVSVDADERIALLLLGSSGIEVLVLHGGRIEYGRGVALVHDWERAEAGAVEELASELRASLSAYRRENEDGSSVERVSVCSDWAGTRALADSLAEASGYPCATTRLVEAVCATGAEKLEGTPLVGLGAALAAQGRAPFIISLAPESLTQARRQRTLKRQSAQAGALVGAILVLVAALYVQATWQRKSYIRELQSRIDAIEPLAESIEGKKKQLAVLKQHVDRRGSALELLTKLVKRAPNSGLTITRFSYIHGQSITVSGRSETITLVDQWIDVLREAGKSEVPQFARVHSGRHDRQEEYGQPVIQYEVVIPLGEGDVESAGETPHAE